MRGAGRLTLLAGSGIVLLAWGLGVAGVPESYQPVADVLAELIAPLTIILGLRYRRGRLAAAAIVLALANFLLRGPLAGGAGGLGLSLEQTMLALLLPINLGVLAILPDRPISHSSSLVHLGIIAAQPMLTAFAVHLGRGAAVTSTATAATLEVLQTRQALLLAFLLAGVFTIIALALRRGAFEGSLLCVLAACLLIIIGSPQEGQTSMLLAASQLVLLVGLVEDSYRLAFHDELTGLPSRRALNETMRTLRGDYALAMVDVDHFKRFNDRYGHDAGDQALRMIADELARVSGGGRAFRYGGEEFSVVFPGCTPAEARRPLEEIRSLIEGKRFVIRAPDRPKKKPKQLRRSRNQQQNATITVSIGVAGPTNRNRTPEEVLKAADRALYRAKKGGRNQLVVG